MSQASSQSTSGPVIFGNNGDSGGGLPAWGVVAIVAGLVLVLVVLIKK